MTVIERTITVDFNTRAPVECVIQEVLLGLRRFVAFEDMPYMTHPQLAPSQWQNPGKIGQLTQ
jgi:hypothetical protein